MKKPMVDSLITAGMITIVLLGGLVIQNKYKNIKLGPEVNIIDSEVFFDTGVVETGSINTGGVIWLDSSEESLSEIDLFYNLQFRESVYFPVQSLDYGGKNYSERTNLLVDQAKNNMESIDVPSGITGGYLYIKLRKDLPVGRTAVIYIKTPSWYCGGGLKQLGYTYNNNEYLYDLKDVSLIGTTCGGDWLSKIEGYEVFIGGYVGTFDGNGIEEITITRY